MSGATRARRLDALRATLRRLDGSRTMFERERVGFGCEALDALLPWRGFPFASLHEVTGDAADGFVAALAARTLRWPGALVWCGATGQEHRRGMLYGPGLARFGVDTRRLVLVRCRDRRELLWAMEEALRCRAVVCTVGELGAADLGTSRRLQLAAESGGGLGFLLGGRLPDLRPNAAVIRLRVTAGLAADRPVWRLEAWRVRGGEPWTRMVRFDETTLSVTVAAGLPDRAPASCEATTGSALSA